MKTIQNKFFLWRFFTIKCKEITCLGNQHGEGVYKSIIIHWSEHWKWKHIQKIMSFFSKWYFNLNTCSISTYVAWSTFVFAPCVTSITSCASLRSLDFLTFPLTKCLVGWGHVSQYPFAKCFNIFPRKINKFTSKRLTFDQNQHI